MSIKTTTVRARLEPELKKRVKSFEVFKQVIQKLAKDEQLEERFQPVYIFRGR